MQLFVVFFLVPLRIPSARRRPRSPHAEIVFQPPRNSLGHMAKAASQNWFDEHAKAWVVYLALQRG